MGENITKDFMEWFNIKDALPKDNTWNVVFGPRHYQIAEYNGNGFWSPCYGCNYWNLQDITHWMPMPRPPSL